MARLSDPAVDRVVGRNVRLARGRLSQGALGDLLGCSFQQVQRYERGEDVVPAPTLLLLARVTGWPVEAFFADAQAGEVA